MTGRPHLTLLVGCLALSAAISARLGQDANWDLLNYHLYNGAALLRGRFDQDLLPAGMQSYLNPLLDALYAGLTLGPLRAHPVWLAATMGLWFGAALYFATRLALLLYGGRLLVLITAVLLGATGTAVVSQIGATTGELPAGAIMLAGLFVLLRGAPAARATTVAGMLFGLAAALKLTAVAYAPAACLAVASLCPPRRLVAACAMFSGGWLAGLLIGDGWWAWRLFERFGSPVFPLFNGVFRSPWYPPASVIDDRFLPHGILQWLFYPFYWMVGAGPVSTETAFHDPRGAVALCLGLAALLAWAAGSRGGRFAFTPVQRAALVFLVAGYVAWLVTSSIMRYAVVIEVVAGLLIPLFVMRLPPGRATLGGLAMVLGLIFIATRYPPSDRVPYGAETLRADMDWVEPGMLIVLTFRGPSSHVVALMPHQDSVGVVNIGDTVLEARGWPLHDEMVRRIRDHVGRVVVVTEGHPLGRFPELGEVGLSPDLANCRPVGSTFVPASETGIHACDARKLDPPRMPSPFWAQAASRYRTLVQPMDAALDLIGTAYLKAAGPAARGTRFIDWTDLLWSGVGKPNDALPAHADPTTLYVLAPEFVLGMAALLDPAVDMLGRVDGVLVAAPGWRGCAICTAPVEPVRITDYAPALTVGGSRALGAKAGASGYLLEGWWPQEPVSVWSRQQAGMAIPLSADLAERAEIVLTGRTLTGPGLATQRVALEIPGQPESLVWRTVSDGAIRFPLRREWLRRYPDGTFLMHLLLRFPDATSPAELGLSIDSRRLGFSLSTVSLEGM